MRKLILLVIAVVMLGIIPQATAVTPEANGPTAIAHNECSPGSTVVYSYHNTGLHAYFVQADCYAHTEYRYDSWPWQSCYFGCAYTAGYWGSAYVRWLY